MQIDQIRNRSLVCQPDFSHAEARRARREEDWIFSAAPRLRVNLGIPLLHNISFLHRCRGFLSDSRIFSHAEARRARREEDWIFSACSAAPREPLYSPSSKLGKLKVVIRKTGDGGPGSADVIVGRCERIDSNPVPRYSAAANSSMLAQVNEVR